MFEIDKVYWSKNNDRYYAYNNEFFEEEIGCMTIKNGIIYCYPIIDHEVLWSESIYYYCLENFNAKHFDEISEDELDTILEKSAEAIIDYYRY